MKLLSVWLKMVLLVSIVLASFNIVSDAKVLKETIVEMQLGNPVMKVNGIRCQVEPGTKISPVSIKNRTYVPIKATIEALGGKVNFIKDTSEIFLSMDENLIRLKLDSKVAYLNGYKRYLEAEVTTIDGVALVPIRYVAQGFGLKVSWDGAKNTIKVIKRIETEDEEEIVLVHDDPRRFSERKYMEDQIKKEKLAAEKANSPYDGERLMDDGYDTSQNNSAENVQKREEEEAAKAEAEMGYYEGGQQ